MIIKLFREVQFMKKFINQVENVELEMLEGIAKAHPQHLKKLPENTVLVRANKKEGKVALISGGGSGHEPAHGGYVGEGMLDAAVAGAVFTSPTPDQVEAAIRAVATDAGVLLIIKNYTGDVMNFEMAAEMAECDGIKCANVVVNDDVAVQDSLYTTGRRGVAGTVFVHKIAGARAEQGASLEEVQATAQKVIDNVRTMGTAITLCTVPAAGKPGFEIGEDEMEVGIGIHGEPGTHKEKLTPVNEIVDHMLDKILTDIDYAGREVAVMVNGSGATPLMERYIINNRVADVLAGKGIKVYKTFVGNYMTSLEMAGFSVSLLRLDDELKALLDAPADTPALKV
jgi:dihydroxyacetone kinase-like protein